MAKTLIYKGGTQDGTTDDCTNQTTFSTVRMFQVDESPRHGQIYELTGLHRDDDGNYELIMSFRKSDDIDAAIAYTQSRSNEWLILP